jgi:hypothetical protein
MATAAKPSPSLIVMLAAACRSLGRDFVGSYHPELHYMRGPGPKWREKHAVVDHAPALPGLDQATA